MQQDPENNGGSGKPDATGAGKDHPDMPAPPGCLQLGPYVFHAEAGMKYAYCMCQRSARFPLCDGTHRSLTADDRVAAAAEERGTGPYKMVPEEPGTIAWCACGRSRTKPFCDGSHRQA